MKIERLVSLLALYFRLTMASAVVYLCAFAGTILRILLTYTKIPAWLHDRKEVITPVTSWDRVLEGIALKKRLISPYDGDIFHETPLMLWLARLTETIPGGAPAAFVFIDIVIGIVLYKVSCEFSKHELQRQENELKEYSPKSKPLLLTEQQLIGLPLAVSIVHFLGPYSVCACLAQSTAVLSNLAVFCCWLYTLRGNVVLSCLFLALAAYQSLYPVIFLVPVSLHHYLRVNPKCSTYTSSAALLNYTRTVLVFAVFLAALIGMSFVLEGSWSFLRATYGFVLSVPDLTPNVGIFWYFFTEMFEHFRVFFVCVFQINVFIYSIPIAVKLRDRPLFHLYVLMFIISIFKSYPSYADTAVYLSLLPLWQHIFSYLRNAMVVSVMYVVVAVVAPILWHLWIYAASANANFYFAITLVFSVAQIFLLTDLLFAFLRYEYDLHHGMEHRLPNGKKTTVVLE